MSGTQVRQREKGMGVGRVPTLLVGIAPVVMLGLVLAGVIAVDPLKKVKEGFPPVEELTVTRTVLPRPGLIELHVVNGGPEPVIVAQVAVDEAYWSYSMDAGKGRSDDAALAGMGEPERTTEQERRRTIGRLGRAVISIPYPWVEGETHAIRLVTSTGVTFDTEIGVAVESPAPNAGYFGLFALIGVLVGVVPVYLGLLWYPMMQRISGKAIDVLLCFTLGLLVFLVVDTLKEALETASSERMPEAYDGTAIVVLGVAGSVLLLLAIGSWLRGKTQSRGPGFVKLGLAYMIATGIGVHNLGEGLAIGAAFNLGEVSLGMALLIGFMIHNVTEGLAIVAPLAKVKAGVQHLLWLGLLAGGPTVLGGWLGAFAYSAFWSVLFLAIGAGAILQVIYEVTRQMAAGAEWRRVLTPLPNLGGLAAGFLLMYVTGLFVAF
jgi:ZIP family zinc transporter